MPLWLGNTGGVGAADADDEETEDVWGIMAGTWQLASRNELLAVPVPYFLAG
jgi:hypothetical protein